MKRLIAHAGQVKTPPLTTMPRPAPSALESDIAAALDWWRQAGVDAAFVDEPQAWLGTPARGPTQSIPPSPEKIELPQPPPPQIGGAAELWPQNLAAFREWWLAEPSLDAGGLSPRVAPRGEADADLMSLVGMPEEHDGATLLSGPHGVLLGNFLRAAQIAPHRVYLASVLPRRTALPDWGALATEGLGKVLAHHVSLVRPKRLLIFGRHILPLCGHDPAQGTAASIFFNHEGGRVRALAEARLERLLGNPQLRVRLWKRWLDWTDG
jgi:DNA polymerase